MITGATGTGAGAQNDFSAITGSHRLILDDRHLLTVTGVTDVDTFDENKIEARTPLGSIIIEGEELHIVRLMIESSELVVEGSIGGIAYIDRPASIKGGFFSKFR